MEKDLITMHQYLDHLSANKREDTTIETYQHYLYKLAEWLEEKNTSYQWATTAHLNEFTGSWAHKQGISRSSRRVMITAVRGLFRWLKEKKYREGNPAKSLNLPKQGRPLPVPMSLNNVEKLFSVIDYSTLKGLRDAAMIALMVDSGMRLSGLINLNESSLIRYTIKEKDRLSVRVIEKGAKERLIPISDYSLVYLSAYLNSRELQKIDRILPDSDKVLFVAINNRKLEEHEFVGENRRLSKRAVQNMMRHYAKKAGVPFKESHPHALRHRFGTEMVESNVDLLTVRDLLGHADIKTTQIYIHLARGRMHDSIDKGSPLSKIDTPLSSLVEKLD